MSGCRSVPQTLIDHRPRRSDDAMAALFSLPLVPVGLFLLSVLQSPGSAGCRRRVLETTALESDAVIQEQRVVFSADVANAVAGIKGATLRNDK
jgi:hypothetical protein